MAGDWIKIELTTPDKPEVLAISSILNIPPEHAFGCLFMVWRWFDQHTINGNAASVSKTLLDRLSGVSGFGDAMQKVGWLVETEKGIALPQFDRHCGETAKKRALTAKRVAKHKEKSNAKGNADSVSESVSSALPREEKRREEYLKEKYKKEKSRAKHAIPPDFEINARMIEWVKTKNLTIDIQAATERWSNAMQAKGTKYSDWGKAWQNGMLLAQSWADEKKPKIPVTEQRMAEMVELAAKSDSGVHVAEINGKIITIRSDGRVSGWQ